MSHPYYFNFKSEELRGAGQPNSATLRVADDATAITTGDLLEALLNAELTSITTHLASPAPNYPSEYNAGTDNMLRMNFRGTDGTWYNAWLADCVAAPDLTALETALIASSVMPDSGTAVESVNFTKSARKAFRAGF